MDGFLFAEKSAYWLLSKVNRSLLSLRLACVVFHLKGGEGGLDERPERESWTKSPLCVIFQKKVILNLTLVQSDICLLLRQTPPLLPPVATDGG